MKPSIALIDWCGPFSPEDARPAAFDFDDGLYLAIGRQAYERTTNLQYIGLASSVSQRLGNAHHKLGDVKKDVSLWLGEISSPRTPGRKLKVTDRLLDLAEWAQIYYLDLPLNEKKRKTPPDQPIIVYNRWWTRGYTARYEKRPHKDWPDLIDYSEGESSTRVVWFGGVQQKIDEE